MFWIVGAYVFSVLICFHWAKTVKASILFWMSLIPGIGTMLTLFYIVDMLRLIVEVASKCRVTKWVNNWIEKGGFICS